MPHLTGLGCDRQVDENLGFFAQSKLHGLTEPSHKAFKPHRRGWAHAHHCGLLYLHAASAGFYMPGSYFLVLPCTHAGQLLSFITDPLCQSFFLCLQMYLINHSKPGEHFGLETIRDCCYAFLLFFVPFYIFLTSKLLVGRQEQQHLLYILYIYFFFNMFYIFAFSDIFKTKQWIKTSNNELWLFLFLLSTDPRSF